MIEHGGTQAGTGAGGTGVEGDDGGERLYSADEIAPIFKKATRTIHDWWDLGKMGYVRLGKKRKFSTLAQIEARRQQLYREKHPLEAPLTAPTGSASAAAFDGPVEDGGPDAHAASLAAQARLILGDQAPPEAIAHLSEDIRTYRLDMEQLHPETRLLLVREYFSRVRASTRLLTQAGPGLVAATLVLAAGMATMSG